jgi:hypothetical protein
MPQHTQGTTIKKKKTEKKRVGGMVQMIESCLVSVKFRILTPILQKTNQPTKQTKKP